MNVPLVVDVLLKQPEYKHWSRRDAINALAKHAQYNGLIWVSDENGNSCLILGRPLRRLEDRIERWDWYIDGPVMFVDLMCSDSPELSLIALRNAVNKWSRYSFLAFDRRDRGLRVFSPRFALRLAKQIFGKICNNGIK